MSIFFRGRIQRLEKRHGVADETGRPLSGCHDGKWLYDHNWIKVGPIPPELIGDMTRDEAVGIGFRHEGILYVQYALRDQTYDTDDSKGFAKLGETFTGEAKRNILAIERYMASASKRSAKQQAKIAAKHKVDHPDPAIVEEAPEPEPANVIPFAEAARLEQQRKARVRGEAEIKHQRDLENLRRNDRAIRARDKAMGMTKGIQKGVRQW